MSEPIEPIELDDESNNTEQSQDDSIKKEEPQPQVKGSVKYGEDVFSHVKPLSIVAFNITTPTGKVLKCRSQYVGLHSKHLIVIETPMSHLKKITFSSKEVFPLKRVPLTLKEKVHESTLRVRLNMWLRQVISAFV